MNETPAVPTNINQVRDNSGRARAVIIAFLVLALIDVIAIVSGYFQLDLIERVLGGMMVTEEEAGANDLRQQVIGVLQTGVNFLVIVLFINWFRRAYANVERAGIPIDHKDSMAAWSFFIPFVNWFRPAGIASEISRKTARAIQTRRADFFPQSATVFVGLWWAAFLINNILGRVAARSAFKDSTFDQILFSSQAYLISDAFDILAITASVIFITKVSRDEQILFDAAREH